MNKKLIRLTEGDLHNIVKESVNRILKEVDERKVVRITVPTMNINNKLIEYDDLIAFCNEHNLGVWDWNKMTFIPIEEFEYKPSWHSVGSYGLSTNHGFQTAPEITLVAQGTKAPNNSWQKRFILPDGY